MREKEWRRSKAPVAMLEHLENCGQERKLRLFAVACCRRHFDKMPDARCQRAVEASERFADGMEPVERLIQQSHDLLYFDLRDDAVAAANLASSAPSAYHFGGAAYAVAGLIRRIAGRSEISPQVHLIRCIFGNPFRPVAFDPQWLTSTVTQLAQGIYDDHAFDRMPILADALQDAGCDNNDILNHCRDPKGIHARGCWVVDLVLGKD